MYDKLFFLLKPYINPAQHGFVSGRSTTTNLAVFTRYCINSFEKGDQVDAVYTDLSKAFDKVPHNVLLFKLSKIGLHSNILNWFKSYLMNRTCVVCIDGVFSDKYVPTSGVPQGSVLGPLLFNLFVNDIASCFINARHLMYADDLKIFLAVRSLNDIMLLQEDIDRLGKWSINNGLTINQSKCLHVTFHKCRNVILSQFKIFDHILESVLEVHDLGVVFDAKFTFTPHLDYIIPKAYSSMYFIRRNTAQFTDPYVKKIIYSSFTRSKLEYASFIWSPTASIHINRIEKVQRSFTKFALNSINFSGLFPSYNSRCLLISLKSLKSRREISSLMFLQSVLTNSVDCAELLSFIQFNAPSRLLRFYFPFHIGIHTSNYALNEPFLRAMMLYNSLYNFLDLTIPLNRFKSIVNIVIQ